MLLIQDFFKLRSCICHMLFFHLSKFPKSFTLNPSSIRYTNTSTQIFAISNLREHQLLLGTLVGSSGIYMTSYPEIHDTLLIVDRYSVIFSFEKCSEYSCISFKVLTISKVAFLKGYAIDRLQFIKILCKYLKIESGVLY